MIFTVAPAIIAFACAFLTGIIFGHLPARKAAQLDPIDALARDQGHRRRRVDRPVVHGFPAKGVPRRSN